MAFSLVVPRPTMRLQGGILSELQPVVGARARESLQASGRIGFMPAVNGQLSASSARDKLICKE
jgi:hypothetical protein